MRTCSSQRHDDDGEDEADARETREKTHKLKENQEIIGCPCEITVW